jgi:hypothetical protein
MDENVRTIIPADKAISLRIVKPFDCANHLALLLKIVLGPRRGKANCWNAVEAIAEIAVRTDRLKSDKFEESD